MRLSRSYVTLRCIFRIFHYLLQMWDIFFPKRFCSHLEESSTSNQLSIMSCGSVSTESIHAEQSKNLLIGNFFYPFEYFVSNQCSNVHRQYFNNIYTFTQANFQPSLSFPFFHRLVLDTFVYDRKAVKYVLNDCQGLGSHTGIMEFTRRRDLLVKGSRKMLQITGPTQFTWTHPGVSPAGKAIDMQCSS